MASIPFERVRRLTLAPSINRRSIVSKRPVRVTALASGETSLTTVGLIAVLLGSFLATTDFSIVNVALPTIDADLHASAGMLQLVVAGYGTPFALLLVIGGRLGDAFGRRRLFSIGMGAFTLASLLCGLAPSIGWLVLARAAQGAAAAMMVPQVLSTIQATTTGDRRAQALGAFGATGALAAAAGQVLGGALVTLNIGGTQWRTIFLVNLPIGLLGILLAARRVPDSRSGEPAAIDPAGTALLTAAVAGVLIPLTEGRTLGWPWWSILLLASVPFSVLAFLWVERGLERAGRVPLVPLSIVRVRSMSGGLLVTLLFFAGLGGFMFVYPLSLQGAAHLTAIEAGSAIVPMALGFLVTSLSVSRLLRQFGSRVIVVGLLLGTLGVTMLSATLVEIWPHVDPLLLAPSMLVAGVGWGLVISPLFGIVLSEVPARRVGAGSGVLATTQQIASSLGVATLGSLFMVQQQADHLGSLCALVMVLVLLAALGGLAAVVARRIPG